MRVGLDYLPAVTHAPGVGRYARELVRALVRLPACPELFLFQIGGVQPSIAEPALGLVDAPHSPARGGVHRRALRVPRRWFEMLGLSADTVLGGVDVFHHILPEWPPIARARQVQPIIGLPAPGSKDETRLRKAFADRDRFVTFSAHGGELLASRYGVPPERIEQVPVGCEHWIRVLPEPGEREWPPSVVVLGSVRSDRHHALCVAAFEELLRRDVAGRLRILGGRDDAAAALDDALAATQARDAVHWFERPREGQLPGIVARASVLLHLADEELTAVTPLEAFSFGTPVVASRLPAFEEALGGEAELVDLAALAGDPQPLADALERAVASAKDDAAAARRRAVAARFPWAANAQATVRVWERTAAGA